MRLRTKKLCAQMRLRSKKVCAPKLHLCIANPQVYRDGQNCIALEKNCSLLRPTPQWSIYLDRCNRECCRCCPNARRLFSRRTHTQFLTPLILVWAACAQANYVIISASRATRRNHGQERSKAVRPDRVATECCRIIS